MTFMTDDGQPLFEQPVPLRALRVTLKVVRENPGESRKRLLGISMTADCARHALESPDVVEIR